MDLLLLSGWVDFPIYLPGTEKEMGYPPPLGHPPFALTSPGIGASQQEDPKGAKTTSVS